MEIIVHGKPGSRSSKMTSGLDAVLGNRIVDGFFNTMGSINEPDFLVVDAVYWNNKWYSIYTFELYKEIKDIADRPSYFALSVVIPNQYYCLVSEVYERLKKVCRNYVIGKYISAEEGKYLIPDLGDKLLFDNLVKEISHDYANLLEDFDNGFKPLNGVPKNVFYNPVDCDSKAFVQSLRVNGRVIVCEKAYTKDYLLDNIGKIKSELAQAQNIICVKDAEITRLNKKIDEIETTLNATGKQSSKRLRELENGTATFKNENETLRNLNKDYVLLIDKYKSKIAEIANITKTVDKDKRHLSEEQKNGIKSSAIGKKSKLLILSFINTLLLIFLLTLLCVKSCDNEKIYGDGEDVTQIENVVTDRTRIGEDSIDPEIGNMDDNCGLSIINFSGKIPLPDGALIDNNIQIVLTIQKENADYKIYTDNLKNGEELKFGEPFKVLFKDENKPIVISYRSDDINKANPENKITLKFNN